MIDHVVGEYVSLQTTFHPIVCECARGTYILDEAQMVTCCV